MSPMPTAPAPMRPPTASARWELWSTYAFLAVTDPGLLAPARALAEEVIAHVDRACSRFRADSDLSRVNSRPGAWVPVDPLLVSALRVALDSAEQTEGLVDPCLGRRLVELGYDIDLAVLVRRGRPDRKVPPDRVRTDAWREVELADDAVRIPDDVALDLGAVAKAWAADLVATTVADRLDQVCVVSLGGDVRVAGPDGTAASWPVRVAERPDGVPDGLEVVVSGGLATSTTLVRRWRGRDGELHHLLDPRTGQPTDGALRTVTAAGGTCVAANTASTAALVLGGSAPEWLERHGVTARLVARDGSTTTTGDWPEEAR